MVTLTPFIADFVSLLHERFLKKKLPTIEFPQLMFISFILTPLHSKETKNCFCLMTLTLFFLATIGITLHVWLFFPSTYEIRNSQINQYMLSIALAFK